MSDFQRMSNAIKEVLDGLEDRLVIFPYGEYGVKARQILVEQFGFSNYIIVDNEISKYNEAVYDVSIFSKLNASKCKVLFVCKNPCVRGLLLDSARSFFDENRVIDVFRMDYLQDKRPVVGKYSYGPLCEDTLVDSIGSFCSFASGTVVVPNHPINYISTHDFIFHDNKNGNNLSGYNLHRGEKWFFDGVEPQGIVNIKRITIGNDVWLGQNVIVTNNSNIGNGVIAGAGAVITKNVPDYAIVVGVPARIIKYRYTEKQIAALNKISWWDWDDNLIRERYQDFFIGIDSFIEKYIEVS